MHINPLNAELNPICHLLALLRAHHILHISWVRVNIILPSTSWSPQWSLSLRLPHQHPVYTSILPHTRHMPCPSHSSRLCGSDLTIVKCGIFLCVTFRRSERDNCNDIWGFLICVTNVWQDPEASLFRLLHMRLQVSCVR